MSWKNRIKQNSLFYRILFYLTLTVLAIAVCCFFLLHFLKINLYQTKLQEQDSYISISAGYMDDIFQNISNILTFIENDPDTNKILLPGYQKKSDYFYSEENVVDTMLRFSTMSEEIREIYIYSAYHENLYSYGGTIKPDLYYNNRYDDGYDDWIKVMSGDYPKMESYIQDAPICPELDVRVPAPARISIIKSIRNGNRTMGTIVVVLEDSIVQNVLQNKAFTKGRDIYITDKTGRAIAGTKNNSVITHGMDIKKTEPFSKIDYPKIRALGSYIGDDGLYSYRTSENTDFEYFVFTPSELVAGVTNHMFVIVNTILAGITCVILMLAYGLSQKLYSPFRSIMDVLRDINSPKQADRKNVDELEAGKRKILDIVSINHSLRNTMEDSYHIVLEALLFHLILGISQPDDALLSSAPYDIKFDEGFYNLFVLRMDLQSFSEENFYTEHYENFKNIINTYIAQWHIATVTTHSDEYAIVVYCKDLSNSEKINVTFSEIQEELQKTIPNSQFYIGCGNWTDSILDIHTRYEEAILAIRQRSINSRRMVLMTKSNPIKRHVRIPNDMELELSNQLLGRKREASIQYIRDILERNQKENISTESYIAMCNTVNSFIIRYVEFHDTEQSKSLIAIDPSTFFYSPQKLNDIVLSNLNMAYDILSNPSDSNIPVINQIEQYVNENFNNDINLSTMADKLGYTPNYLSRYFKQMKGINFTDYLNRQKVTYAKMLLTTTTDTIKVVTTESGFNSTALFIKTFEKYEGVTPGEFKKLKNRN